jgi:hypothetical protein
MTVLPRAPRALLLLLATVTLALPGFAATDASAFLGTWQFVREQSTDLSPWRGCDLTLSQTGDELTITKAMKAGRRTHLDTMTLDLTAETNEVPQGWWIGNRHLGAYSPHNATKAVSIRSLDDGKVLRLETDLVLETQQGPRDVNILTQYQISPDGQTLTVTELRSTRPRPVLHVFTRVTE